MAELALRRFHDQLLFLVDAGLGAQVAELELAKGQVPEACNPLFLPRISCGGPPADDNRNHNPRFIWTECVDWAALSKYIKTI